MTELLSEETRRQYIHDDSVDVDGLLQAQLAHLAPIRKAEIERAKQQGYELATQNLILRTGELGSATKVAIEQAVKAEGERLGFAKAYYLDALAGAEAIRKDERERLIAILEKNSFVSGNPRTKHIRMLVSDWALLSGKPVEGK